MTTEQRVKLLEEISWIDDYLRNATGWGSWMVCCANHREDMVNRLRADGLMVEHKYLARTADGERTD